MLTDGYGLPLSTASSVGRDAYVEGCEAKRTMYPGAIEGFERAIAADPGFALAHAARAHVLLEPGDAAARASMAAAKSLAAGLTAREATHIAFFDLLVNGDTETALPAVYAHLNAWPRDVLVLATTAFTNGLIGSSGVPGRNARCWSCWIGSRRATAMIGGSRPITGWRSRRMASGTPPAQRSSGLSGKTRTTRGRHTPAPISAMRRGMPMRPAASWRLGSRSIHVRVLYTAT
jgi:hypothetical protein